MNALKHWFICSWRGHVYKSRKNNLRLYCCARCGLIDAKICVAGSRMTSVDKNTEHR